jgi:hypothetical protein
MAHSTSERAASRRRSWDRGISLMMGGAPISMSRGLGKADDVEERSPEAAGRSACARLRRRKIGSCFETSAEGGANANERGPCAVDMTAETLRRPRLSSGASAGRVPDGCGPPVRLSWSGGYPSQADSRGGLCLCRLAPARHPEGRPGRVRAEIFPPAGLELSAIGAEWRDGDARLG